MYAVTFYVQYFRQSLVGREFLIQSDHKCLEYLHNFKDPSALVQRWISILENYSYEIIHKPATNGLIKVADALSRPSTDNDTLKYPVLSEDETFDPSLLTTIDKSVKTPKQTCNYNPRDDTTQLCDINATDLIQEVNESINDITIPDTTRNFAEVIATAQDKDPALRALKRRPEVSRLIYFFITLTFFISRVGPWRS